MVCRAKEAELALPTSSSTGPGLHRRTDLQCSGGSDSRWHHSSSAPASPLTRANSKALGKARGMLTSRWQLLGLVLAGLMLHSLIAKHTQPWLAASSGSLAGGVAIRGMPTAAGEGGTSGESSVRSRTLVEQHEPDGGVLSSLAAMAADLMTTRGHASPPSSPIPQAWLDGGTLGQWPKPYRNKTRQVVPNSISNWRCTPDAANFSLAAATHNPLLQSTEWREKYGDDVSMFKWCREGLPEEVPQLQQVLKLESAKARPERGLTVVTQLSLERFQMLENQCSTWPLQISAVLYIPLLKGRIFSAEEPSWNKKSLDVGVAETLKFFAAMEASNSSCVLDLEVVVEERCDRYSAMLYPANACRNRALVNAHTEAMLLVDVDFAVSRSLAELVRGEASYQRLMTMLHNRNAVVLPAFETQDDGEAGRHVALEAVRSGKPYVVRMFEWNVVFGFHVPQYPQGHQATDYWRWIKSHGAYPVQYQIGYEPYILMHRSYIPFYDERFRGYYWNKVQHLMHISLQNGFNFLVHPTAFVVHVPHKKPSTKWLTRKMGQKEKNHMLFDNALFHMRQMDFVPVTSWAQMCTAEVAPVLPGEDEAREVAAMKAAAERAAAEQAELMMQQHAALQEAAAATAAKRAAEVAEAEAWMANNAEAAAAATKQRQDAAVEGDEAFLTSQHQHQLVLAVAASSDQVAVEQRAVEQEPAMEGQQDAEQAASENGGQGDGQGFKQAAAGGAGQATEQAAAGGAGQATEQAAAGSAEQAGQEQPTVAADQSAQQRAAAAGNQAAQQQATQQQPASGAQQAAQQQASAGGVQAVQQQLSANAEQAQQPAAGVDEATQPAAAANQEPEQAVAAQEQPGTTGEQAQMQAPAVVIETAQQHVSAQQQPAAGEQAALQQQLDVAPAGAGAGSRGQQVLEAAAQDEEDAKEATAVKLEERVSPEDNETGVEEEDLSDPLELEPLAEVALVAGEGDEQGEVVDDAAMEDAGNEGGAMGEAGASDATAKQRRQ